MSATDRSAAVLHAFDTVSFVVFAAGLAAVKWFSVRPCHFSKYLQPVEFHWGEGGGVERPSWR